MSDFCPKEGFNCKYCEEGECVFYSMGSGQMIDMPCFDYDEFEWISKDVLDKIRAEIEKHCGLVKKSHCRYCSYCNNLMGIREILEVIDKYKESEIEE